jgi:hypothetical protein
VATLFSCFGLIRRSGERAPRASLATRLNQHSRRPRGGAARLGERTVAREAVGDKDNSWSYEPTRIARAKRVPNVPASGRSRTAMPCGRARAIPAWLVGFVTFRRRPSSQRITGGATCHAGGRGFESRRSRLSRSPLPAPMRRSAYTRSAASSRGRRAKTAWSEAIWTGSTRSRAAISRCVGGGRTLSSVHRT